MANPNDRRDLANNRQRAQERNAEFVATGRPPIKPAAPRYRIAVKLDTDHPDDSLVFDAPNHSEMLYAAVVEHVATVADCDNEGAEGERVAELLDQWFSHRAEGPAVVPFHGGILRAWLRQVTS